MPTGDFCEDSDHVKEHKPEGEGRFPTAESIECADCIWAEIAAPPIDSAPRGLDRFREGEEVGGSR